MNTILLASIGLVAMAALVAFTRIKRLSTRELVMLIAGAISGALIGALLSIPLGQLPAPYSNVLPLVVTLLAMAVTAALFYLQRDALAQWNLPHVGALVPPSRLKARPSGAEPQILVDTSVIIDGRIADIAKAGFVPGKLLVPRFVLAELQNIADSDEAMRRGRGRRGLEMLSSLQETTGVQVEIIEHNLEEIKEVDAKLVALAQQLGAMVLTTDYNLNRVAQIEGVRVLNINELANAIRPVVLPGEDMVVKIVQAGKERGQGVGYLPDGTMIVVENGDKLIGQELATEVTRVFQTVAGKMIFATPRLKPTVQAKSTAPSNASSSAPPRGRVRGHKRQSENSPGAIEDRLIRANQR